MRLPIKLSKKPLQLITLWILSSSSSHADPWFTGPLFTLPAYNMLLGQAEMKLTGTSARSTQIYNGHSALIDIPTKISTQLDLEMTYALTKRVDVAYNFFFIDNQYNRKSYGTLGDTSIAIGVQLIDQRLGKMAPNLRFIFQETFPTGRYDQLLTGNNGTDATGMGSYQSLMALSIEHLSHFDEQHYLKAHATVFYNFRSDVSLQGFSIYGGSQATKGHIYPGNVMSLDVSGELTFTQNWVLVFEGMLTYQQHSSFFGNVGLGTKDMRRDVRDRIFSHGLIPAPQNIGGLLIGSGNANQIALAPGLEYNFSEKLGIIVGAWFTVAGTNTLNFMSPALKLVASW